MKDELLAEVELVPTDPKLRAKMSVNNRPLFRIVRQVPARYAAAVTFGSEAQRRRAHAKIRDWLRAKLTRENSWTAEDRACLL